MEKGQGCLSEYANKHVQGRKSRFLACMHGGEILSAVTREKERLCLVTCRCIALSVYRLAYLQRRMPRRQEGSVFLHYYLQLAYLTCYNVHSSECRPWVAKRQALFDGIHAAEALFFQNEVKRQSGELFWLSLCMAHR